MPSARHTAVLERLSTDRGGVAGGTRHLCRVAADVTEVTGAGIMLLDGGVPHVSLGATDERAGFIDELQYTLGEGPCVDADRLDTPVVEPDLVAPRTLRWPAFRPLAACAGVAAVFGFPLRVEQARLGVLELYRDRPGGLDDDQIADALVIADFVAGRLLDTQLDAEAETAGSLLAVDADFQLVVHQASGMVSVRLGIDVAEALLRIRARAFATDRPVAALAADVVARRLRFDDGHLPGLPG